MLTYEFQYYRLQNLGFRYVSLCKMDQKLTKIDLMIIDWYSRKASLWFPKLRFNESHQNKVL